MYILHAHYMQIACSEYKIGMKLEKKDMNQEQSIFCDCKHHKIERFLEVCLLLLLYDEVGYGYGLIEKLPAFGFSGDELNIGTLYRSLRKLEKQLLVSSVWEEAGQGPKRRVYQITEKGKYELEVWIHVLKERKFRIEQVIGTFYKKISEKRY